MDTLTFAIPYYQGLAFLEKAIASVFQQTRSDWHLIVCDDNPNHDAEALVKKYSDPRVEYHANEKTLGMVGNWNRCLQLAKTTWVTLLHADDALLPNYGQVMAEGAVSFPKATALFCRTQIIDGADRSTFSFPDFYKALLLPSRKQAVELKGDDGLYRLLRGNFLFCPTVCFHKKRLGSHRFNPSWKMVQDLELWSTLLLTGGVLVGLPQIAYSYRRHAQNTTVHYTRNALRFKEEAGLYRQLSLEAKKRGWKKTAHVARQSRIIKMNLAYCILKEASRLQLKEASEKFNLLLQLSGRRADRQTW